jgi:hypothetical protein
MANVFAQAEALAFGPELTHDSSTNALIQRYRAAVGRGG